MRLPAPAGVALPVAQRRLLPGYMQPAIVVDGSDTTTSLRARASLTTGAANTKGSWSQVIAATTSEINMIYLSLTAGTFASATNTSCLVDIGIGAAASEVVIVPNIALGYRVITLNTCFYAFPVNIPLGSRVAVRGQGAEASKGIAVEMTFAQLPNGRKAPTSIIDMGTDTATSKGVTVSNPGSNNTKGSWTQIIAATAEPFDALIVGAQGAAGTAFTASGEGLVDIGYGASGAEVKLVENLKIQSSVSEQIHLIPHPLIIPCRLPAGTRLAARYQRSVTTMPLDIILYGVRT